MDYAWRRVMRFKLEYMAMMLALTLVICGCEMGSGNIANDKMIDNGITNTVDTSKVVEAGGENVSLPTETYAYEGKVLTDVDGFGVRVSKGPSEGVGGVQLYLLDVRDHSASVQFFRFDEQENVVGSNKYGFEVDTETVEELCGKSDAENWEYIYSMIADLVVDEEPTVINYVDDKKYRDIISSY